MLNDLLAPEVRGRGALPCRFDVSPSIKALIESFGVPHTEVALAVRNGEPVDLSAAVAAGDRIAVYPPFRSIDLAPHHGPLRFILDVHLGRLARWLRMLGFDAVWSNNSTDAELAHVSAAEDRILLTRDRGLLMRSEVTRGYWLRSSDPKQQLAEVAERYTLIAASQPFTRCLECNTPLEAADVSGLALPEPILARNREFRQCPTCGRTFWQGSHYQRMSQLIDSLRAIPATGRRGETSNN
jgi:uncharacterized protein with PIN domain/sulfur carrier protein ThiS